MAATVLRWTQARTICEDPSEDDSSDEKTESTTNAGYVKHTHTCVDQIASLGVVCVIESKPSVCVCVTVSVGALVQFRAGASQTHL